MPPSNRGDEGYEGELDSGRSSPSLAEQSRPELGLAEAADAALLAVQAADILAAHIAGDGGKKRRRPRLQWLLSKPARWRRRLVQQPWLLPVAAMHLAAIRVQRCWRTSWLRTFKPSAAAAGSAAPLPSVGVSLPNRTEQRGREGLHAQVSQAARSLQQRHQEHLSLRRRQQDPGKVYPTFEEFCVAVIQGRWRSTLKLRQVRRIRFYQSLKICNVAAFEIQTHWRSYMAWLRAGQEQELQDQRSEQDGLIRHAKMLAQTARKLQRAWRGICDYRVYESLRDTIGTFRRSGDPYLLLKSVLPRESMLVDPAMQVHVRFRLGGSRFPPTIYYKIYTHGAVVDVGSFAPRNYALEREIGCKLQPGDAGWYERVEYNGWRPLAVRLAKGKERVMDEVEKASARKPIKNFHYSRLRRRQDQERTRRTRAIEWMRKLHGLEEGNAASTTEADRPYSESNLDVSTPRAGFAAGAPGGLGGVARRAGASSRSPGAGATVGGLAAPRPPLGAPAANRPVRQGTRPRSASSGVSEGTTEAAQTPYGPSPRLTIGAVQEADEASLSDEDEPLSDDMLLDWTRKLDFDSYMEGWQTAATTDGSEGRLPISTMHSRFGMGLVY